MLETSQKITVKFGAKDHVSRQLYDAIMELADFDHSAPAEELTHSQDLSRFGWCKVCNKGFKPGGTADRVRLVSTGICQDCDFALDLWRMRDDQETARINGQHYRVGNTIEVELNPKCSFNELIEIVKKKTPSKWGNGMGGQVNVIQFSDGRTVVTNDLWHQGDVPPLVKHLLPNNAVFIEVGNGAA